MGLRHYSSTKNVSKTKKTPAGKTHTEIRPQHQHMATYLRNRYGGNVVKHAQGLVFTGP